MESGKQTDLTGRIIRGIIQVRQALGPGFMESIYQHALTIELREAGLRVEPERLADVTYRGEVVGRHRLDLIVEDMIVLELKATSALTGGHYAQLRSCMRAARCDVGLLVNFGGDRADPVL